MATVAQAATAGQPDLAPPEPEPQLPAARVAARRPGRRGTPATIASVVAARRRRGTLADRDRCAPGKRVMDWLDGAVLPAAATTGRTRLELAVADQRRDAGLALAGAPVQRLLRPGAGGVGTGLRGRRLQPVSEPAHRARGLGYRAGVSPTVPAFERHNPCPVAGSVLAVAHRTHCPGGRTGPGGARQPAPAGAIPDQPGVPGQHQGDPRSATIQEPGNRHPLSIRRKPGRRRKRGRRQHASMAKEAAADV
ncbi:hypothetical protein D3C73_1061910 [compost metagenome]